MNNITDNTIIIIRLTDTDRICSLYREIKNFDFFRALIQNKHNNNQSIVFDTPLFMIVIPSTLHKDIGLTSDIFAIINSYRLTNTFHSLTKENVECVLNILLQIGEDFNTKTISHELQLQLVNNMNNIHIIEKVINNTNFINKHYELIDIEGITELFIKNNISIDKFKHIFIDKQHNTKVLCGHELIQTKNGDNTKSYLICFDTFNLSYRSSTGSVELDGNKIHIQFWCAMENNQEYGYIFKIHMKYDKKIEYSTFYSLNNNIIRRCETFTNPLNTLNNYVFINKIFTTHSLDCTHLYIYTKYQEDTQ